MLIRKFYRQNSIISSRNIIITGSPRSGTTWLAELLQSEEKSFLLFEPLSLRNTKFKEIGFDWRQHIPLDKEWSEAEETFRKLFEGKYITNWMLSHSDKSSILKADHFILKFVRANLLLPWLAKKFETERKPIFIIRNPIEVVRSQMENNWQHIPGSFLLPNSKFSENYYLQFQEILNSIKTPSEHLTARWCLDNYYLVNFPDQNKWITVNYNELKKDPVRNVQQLFATLNINFTENLSKKLDVKSRSTYIKSNTNNLSPKKFNEKECLTILKEFKMDNFIN